MDNCCIELLELSKISPSADNPRKDFGDIDALADAIRATGGQPVNPIVVGRDGPLYRVADGHRRYLAMRKIHGEDGMARCLVFDSISDAHAVVAMLATDDKKALTEAEKAQGFQLAFSLGAEEVSVARAVRRSVADVRLARKVADKAPEQATIDQMVEAASFESEADQLAVLRCAEDKWREKAKRIREDHQKEAAERELRACFAELGLEVHDECPEGYKSIMWATNADDMRRLYSENEGKDLAVWPTRWDAHYWYLGYRMDETGLPVETAEERERRELDERRRAAFKYLKQDLMIHVASSGAMPLLQEHVGKDRQKSHSYEVGYLRTELGDANASNDVIQHALQCPASIYEVLVRMRGVYHHEWADFVLTYLPIAVEDGFVPGEEDEWLLEQARAEQVAKAATGEEGDVDGYDDDEEDW